MPPPFPAGRPARVVDRDGRLIFIVFPEESGLLYGQDSSKGHEGEEGGHGEEEAGHGEEEEGHGEEEAGHEEEEAAHGEEEGAEMGHSEGGYGEETAHEEVDCYFSGLLCHTHIKSKAHH